MTETDLLLAAKLVTATMTRKYAKQDAHIS